MSYNSDKILSQVDEAIVLGNFKSFCDTHSSTKEKQRLRNIFKHSTNNTKTIVEIFNYEMKVSLNEYEANRILQLIKAYLNKSLYRKKIDESVKKQLLNSQGNLCAICNSEIKQHYHADHIVPFKYVGDELANNLQMLCANCNIRKNANLDYQIKYLLKLV